MATPTGTGGADPDSNGNAVVTLNIITQGQPADNVTDALAAAGIQEVYTVNEAFGAGVKKIGAQTPFTPG